ncbi:aspartic peptidase domain-containing protein [Cercophora scortea]|uniref:Aspartic peptidase domain-containing protein n=1 Tax=Cercophora scortea TaxID=314031 RepID=A0AAE0IW17_9PEZI|nr:aspartic peptidase domain-containing protein [Cercophora scortea]
MAVFLKFVLKSLLLAGNRQSASFRQAIHSLQFSKYLATKTAPRTEGSQFIPASTSETPHDTRATALLPHGNAEYTSTLTLGEPGQPFRVLLDISSSDLFIPSSACHTPQHEGICGTGHNLFHPARSPTYRSTAQTVTCDSDIRFNYQANISFDTLNVAGLFLQDQASTRAYGILGLAPDDENSASNTTSFLTNLVNCMLLDRDVISILLGRSEQGYIHPGEIQFGGINDELVYPGTTMRFLPLTHKKDDPNNPNNHFKFLTGTWQTSVECITLRGRDGASLLVGSGSAEASPTQKVFHTNGTTARFDTLLPFLVLPDAVAQALKEIASHFLIDLGFLSGVLCQDRWKLLELVFTMSGEDFVLSPHDYTLQTVWDEMRGHVCLLMIQPVASALDAPVDCMLHAAWESVPEGVLFCAG